MKTEEIREGNKLIAEFMGAEYLRKKDFFSDRIIENMYFSPGVFRDSVWDGSHNTGVETLLECLLYHKYWDWLMPACEKAFQISSTQPNRPTPNHCSKLDWLESNISCHIREYNREGAFAALVEFVKHYAQQNSPAIRIEAVRSTSVEPGPQASPTPLNLAHEEREQGYPQ